VVTGGESCGLAVRFVSGFIVLVALVEVVAVLLLLDLAVSMVGFYLCEVELLELGFGFGVCFVGGAGGMGFGVGAAGHGVAGFVAEELLSFVDLFETVLVVAEGRRGLEVVEFVGGLGEITAVGHLFVIICNYIV
jgi:hypothetical protein